MDLFLNLFNLKFLQHFLVFTETKSFTRSHHSDLSHQFSPCFLLIVPGKRKPSRYDLWQVKYWTTEGQKAYMEDEATIYYHWGTKHTPLRSTPVGLVLRSLSLWSPWFDLLISHQDLIFQAFSLLFLQKSRIGQNVKHHCHSDGHQVKSLLFTGKKTIKYYYENKN